MGKRKNKVQVQAKTKLRSSKVFDCPLCDNVKCIEINISKSQLATLKCRQCGTGGSNIPTNGLTQAIDVFSDWMDTIRETQKKTKSVSRPTRPPPSARDESEGEDDY